MSHTKDQDQNGFEPLSGTRVKRQWSSPFETLKDNSPLIDSMQPVCRCPLHLLHIPSQEATGDELHQNEEVNQERGKHRHRKQGEQFKRK